MDKDNRIVQIFEQHYGREDALEIDQCIKGIIDGEKQYEQRLMDTLMKNDWSTQDAQLFVDYLTERSKK